MPIRKQKIMVASRTKMSMARSLSRSVERHGFAMRWNRIGRRAEPDPFDDEQQETDAADRNRQGGDADRQEREVRDGVVPGQLDQAFAPDDHEQRNQRHHELDEQFKQLAEWRRRL